MTQTFRGSFTQQEPIPEDGIAAAVAVMRSGRLHRYNLASDEIGEVSALEAEFAASTGARHALAVASGGYALRCALRSLDVRPGEPVLTNAFTLAPVPGAIAALSARPIYVGVTPSLTIDLEDLEAKAGAARVLLLSHMRGHIADMDRLMAICDVAGVTVVEDCAHTMGASWRGVPSGRHGAVGCYSTQTYKHLNSGEGGLIATDDPDLAARMILSSGSYGFHDRHGTAPSEEHFADVRWTEPNVSGRMDALRAAILRPQLRLLEARRSAWNDRYHVMEKELRRAPGVTVIERPEDEEFVGSSIQWLVPDWPSGAIHDFVAGCAVRGVEIKWFGAAEPKGFTSTYRHWRYAGAPDMPNTDRLLACLLDMRLPLTFSLEDCSVIARIIAEEASKIASSRAELVP